MTETATRRPRTPRLERPRSGRLVAGVGAGLARHLGIDAVVARLALLALGFGGIGIVVYIILVLFVPVENHRTAAGRPAPVPESADTPAAPGGTETPDTDTDTAKRKGRALSQLLAYCALAGGLGMLALLFGGWFEPVLWFIIFGALGAAILWKQANPGLREEWMSASVLVQSGKSWVRTSAGVLLVFIGAIGFLVFQQQLNEARAGLTFAATIVAGMSLIAAPWIIGLVRERDRERRERIRSQERAELAAHIHDSVLHTLALIQRRSEDSREVQRLARVQERALRSWLYQGPADAETTVKPALERVAAEVEEAHGVPIEVVCVGDCTIDDAIQAELGAAREAMVNASKYAGSGDISVFAEVDPEEVLVFIRDRGAGFDLDAIPADRMGVRGSILGRMERHGGSARIRTAPGEGTEVQLRMPREQEPAA